MTEEKIYRLNLQREDENLCGNPFRLIIISLLLLNFLALPGTIDAAIDAAIDAKANESIPLAYQQRGDEVTGVYEMHLGHLAVFHEKLRDRLTRDAPELVARLPDTPEPVPYGYQIVPKLISAQVPSKEVPRVLSTTYSWPRTANMIADERLALVKLTKELLAVPAKPIDLYTYLENVTNKYIRLHKNQELIDAHLKHNRFWQNAIHHDKARYERFTLLHDQVLQRRDAREALQLATIPAEIESLKVQEREAGRFIAKNRDYGSPPSFVKVLHPAPAKLVLLVSLYTDIQDLVFLQGCKEAIEQRWQITDEGQEFRLHVNIKTLGPSDLYQINDIPEYGAHINLRQHVARFPLDGGVLTTGAESTYSIPGRFVALGPKDISTNTVAHEFGHILGFVDYYFRGYRYMGSDGYAILEVIPDYSDIMSAPRTGQVMRSHFDKITAGINVSD